MQLRLGNYCYLTAIWIVSVSIAIKVVLSVIMLSCKELPADSIRHPHDDPSEIAAKSCGNSSSDSYLYRCIFLSLLAHLTLFGLFFLNSLFFPEETLPKSLIIPIKLVTVQMGSEPEEAPSPPSAEKVVPVNPPAPEPPASMAEPAPKAAPEVTEPAPAKPRTEPKLIKEKKPLPTPLEPKAPAPAREHILRAPAIAPSVAPQPPVEQNPAPVSEEIGSELGNALSNADILRRYEQVITLWFEQHKIYPAASAARGDAGEAMLRIRINRQGEILFYSIERSTGHEALDNAIVSMVEKANPVPSIPPQYTADNQVEFLLPISFTH